MKRIYTLLVLVLLSLTAAAQSIAQQVLSNPRLAAGVYVPYTYTTQHYTPAPKGYTPFYISHYGRHGSRYILTDEEVSSVVKVLQRAHDEHHLTPLGEDVLHRMQHVASESYLRAGDLTPLGEQQHRGIAQRMYARFPEIFRHDPTIDACASVVPRVILSMSSFLEELGNLNPRLRISQRCSRREMVYLNPYASYNRKEIYERNMALRYPRGPWVAYWKSFSKKTAPYKEVCARLFSDMEYADYTFDLCDFAYDLYHNAMCLPGTPIKEDLRDLFTPEQLFNFWRCSNAIFYFEKGNAEFCNGYLSEMSAPLLKNLLDDADRCIAARKPHVTLRFGHDGVLMALYSYMGMEGWSARMPGDDITHLHDYFQSYQIPMAANMQMIFYAKAGSDDVLFRLLLNERETLLPLPTDCAPYYHWKDFSAKYRALLATSKLW